MLTFLPGIDPVAGMLWLAAIAVASFLVSWLATDRLGIPRMPYVGLLTLVTGALTVAYLLWSGAGPAFWTHSWVWGLLGAVVAGGLLVVAVSRRTLPGPSHHETGPVLIVWDAVVYGATEGLLLSVLPVAVVWQAFAGAGWTGGWLGAVAGAVAVLGSITVVVAHHLGYRGFRGREMVLPVIGCGLLSIAFLVTGSPIAAMVGHMVLHVGLMRKGSELPPFGEAQLRPHDTMTTAAR